MITIAGDYTGSGAYTVDVDTSNDSADVMTIAGNSSGSTVISVNNISPTVATGNDIVLVSVAGTSAASDFTLAGGVLTAGSFDYMLVQQGNDFVLVTASVACPNCVYDTAPVVLAGFNRLPTLLQRVGQRQWGDWEASDPESLNGEWLRIVGDVARYETSNGDFVRSSQYLVQAGVDAALDPGTHGQWVLGATAHVGTIDATVFFPAATGGRGTIDATGFGIGATATWYGYAGTYVDVQSQVTWISSDVGFSRSGTLAENEWSRGYAFSVEAGHRFALNDTGTLVPQGQLTWGYLDGAEFTDNAGSRVDLGNNETLTGRLGLNYEYEDADFIHGPARFHVGANVLHDFSYADQVSVSGSTYENAASQTWGELAVGASMDLNPQARLYSETSLRRAVNGYGEYDYGMSLAAGVDLQW
jgi:fibronectin-binding autotransporter adhesin